MRIAGLVLAAGESKRLGRPKQLVKYEGKTLLNQAIHTLFETGITDVYVVLGAHRTQIASSIAKADAITIYNDQWRDGMGSSLQTGVKAVSADNQADAILVVLSDQPKVRVAHLNKLINSYDQEHIICSRYNGINGVPTIFPRLYFTDLMSIAGDEGARKVITKYESEVVSFDCPECAVDIDTPSDLAEIK